MGQSRTGESAYVSPLQVKRQMEISSQQEEDDLLSANQKKYQKITDEQLLTDTHYSFLSRSQSRVIRRVGEDAGSVQPAQASESDIASQEQKAGDLTKAQKNLIKQERQLIEAETEAGKKREWVKQHPAKVMRTSLRKKDEEHSAAIPPSLQEEHDLLLARLDAIKAQKDVDLETVKTEEEKLDIRIRAQEAVIKAREDYAHRIPTELEVLRREAQNEREKEMGELRWIKWKKKIFISSGREKTHEIIQYFHKKVEAGLQTIIGHKDENCREDAELNVFIGGKVVHLINTGRAYMGGSKPTYYFMDPATQKKYLYKKAENCCGRSNPKGAVMTEIGAKMQKLLDPEHVIEAVAVKNADGKFIGSVQEIVDVKQTDRVDFEAWEQKADEEKDLSVLTPAVKEQFLTFHVIDWLLCNFDTKGENLLQRSDGQFVSIDKEGAMSHIEDADAQKMSLTYCPHTDPPIYNTFFRLYSKGLIDIPLDKMEKLIQQVEAIPDKTFEEMFKPYLLLKGKTEGSDDYNKYWELIKARKTNLRKSYMDFFNTLQPVTGAGKVFDPEKNPAERVALRAEHETRYQEWRRQFNPKAWEKDHPGQPRQPQPGQPQAQ